jgi:murein DD-endopeptidase MepM/ murein hydrolase activator NlpD
MPRFRADARREEEGRRERWLRVPETAGELVAAGAAGGVVLLAAFVLLQAWVRPRLPPGAPGRAHAGGPAPGRLQFPVPAVSPAALSDSFADARGARTHQAVDIPAPRGSAVVAVDDGTLSRLSRSPAGGISLYLLDAAGRYCFFYAHLERYATGLTAGQLVKRGEVIGYVGTTGNAPPNTPHLHFAIHEVAPQDPCWGGRPIDPYGLLR